MSDDIHVNEVTGYIGTAQQKTSASNASNQGRKSASLDLGEPEGYIFGLLMLPIILTLNSCIAAFGKVTTEGFMHIDLNRYRQAIEKWVAILLLLMFGWLAVGCVLEVYAEDKESNVQVLENKIGSR